VPDDAFLAHLARHVTEPSLDHLRVEDLYLACGCSRGLPWAMAAFDPLLTAAVTTALANLRVDDTLVDEVRQLLRHKLLVGGEAKPRISEYSGRGDLRAWLRAVAAHTALNRMRDERRWQPLDTDMSDALACPAASPELQVIKDRYRADFRDAFAAAMGELESRERNVLRLHYLDGLTLDQVAGVLSVHRATVTQWLSAARNKLRVAVQRHLT
jgi:RNA polymerase sigma-70 factor (ECF subfamily)